MWLTESCTACQTGVGERCADAIRHVAQLAKRQPPVTIRGCQLRRMPSAGVIQQVGETSVREHRRLPG
jgi:hypothetical protein